jgi:3'-phosphoadenosine 5'-phosphosulfate sulfotransferase (PAPS reductase)/FAD synthetase
MLQHSLEIYNQAVADYQPYATVLMLSGGNDSVAAAEVTKALGIPVNFVLHGITGTGIPATLDFVRRVGPGYGTHYIEANAGGAYEQYVLRKGFFGTDRTGHTYAYHILKHRRFGAAISKHIRQRRRRRKVLLLNGARLSESENRRKNLAEPIEPDRQNQSNVWVSLIHSWSKADRDNFLDSTNAMRNPVTQKLCRSGECMCGTMQSKGDRVEAAYYYPEWGDWLDNLEQRVKGRGFDWGWGENMPKEVKPSCQLPLFADFQPACTSCLKGVGDAVVQEASHE